jgi:DNA-binding NarL/FixJ family response regulator
MRLASSNSSGSVLTSDQPAEVAHPVRVLVVAPAGLYREALSLALRQVGIDVVGTADDQSAALNHASAGSPEVIAIDMRMAAALAVLNSLRRDVNSKIVAYGVADGDLEIVGCVEAGAHACVTHSADLRLLGDTIERAARDEVALSPRLAGLLVRRLAARAEPAAPASRNDLTVRERQVLQLIRAVLSNKEIGEVLHISEATVKNHVHSILDKYGVHSRRQVMLRTLDVLLK